MSDPKSLVTFIIEVIEEAAPGRGTEVYWKAFERWQEYGIARARDQAERELIKSSPLFGARP